MTAIMDGTYDRDEELKLEILNAIEDWVVSLKIPLFFLEIFEWFLPAGIEKASRKKYNYLDMSMLLIKFLLVG